MFGYTECPFCDGKIDADIEKEWASYKDYSEDYETDCPKCSKRINVEVRTVPEFWYHKPTSQQKGD